MDRRPWEIGICGTFDVANYGDLLFPLIAEFELTERLGNVRLHRFSYASRTEPEWCYQVTSVGELPGIIHRLDGMLIGGGYLIRFDKQVAPGYYPAAASGIHHPTGYWLTPALLALQHNVPVVWNAPGLHCNQIPAWANPLMEAALTSSRYIAVRDEPSRAALEALTSAPVTVMPDTAFGLPRLLNSEGTPSAEAGLAEGPYIVVQASLDLEGFVRFLSDHAGAFRNYKFLVLPIGPALGEHAGIFDAALPGFVQLKEWPSPLRIAALISGAQAVVGHSYHLMVTALSAGVPVFASNRLSIGKYSAIQQFESIFELPPCGELCPQWLLARVGRKAQSPAARAAVELLKHHWDRTADEFRRTGGPPTALPMNRFWQLLPALLEQDGSPAHDPAEADVWQERVDALVERLAQARAQLAAREADIAEIKASGSWKVTAPARLAGRLLRK